MFQSYNVNKNAFQWDVHHPLVDCIPACTGQGVCIQACTGQGGVCPGGVYPSIQWCRHSPVDRQTDTCENITFANFVCGRECLLVLQLRNNLQTSNYLPTVKFHRDVQDSRHIRRRQVTFSSESCLNADDPLSDLPSGLILNDKTWQTTRCNTTIVNGFSYLKQSPTPHHKYRQRKIDK